MHTSNQTYNVAPFPAFPSVSRYVALGSVEDALTRVSRSVEAREAISLIIGPPGTGKTLICNLLAEQYADTHDVVVLSDTTIENRAAFLRHLLHHMGADYSSTPDNDLHLALVDQVCGLDAAPGGLLIIVDEAQSLTPEVLESIRMVTNIMRSGQPRVAAVVCGGMKLEEALIDTSLEAFTQRVATRCYLHPMNGVETRFYVHETIRACGADPEDTISDEAIAAIHHAASGVPRLVNQMMTQAIDCAAEADTAVISEQVVDRAWATLQQLPSPMVNEPKLKSSGSSTIEFGELELTPAPKKTSTQMAANAETKTLDFSDDDELDFDVEPTSNIEDIEVESSTAMWIDESEPREPINEDVDKEMAVSPVNLFGDFDSEEEVTVGAVAAKASIRSNNDCDLPSAQPTMDLEAMLHQEIIGLSTFDDSVMIMSEPTCDDQPTSESLHLMSVEDDRESEADDFSRDDIRLAHDDSDLLVIEDELDLIRADSGRVSDSAPRSVTIDFQAMLSKMRTGS